MTPDAAHAWSLFQKQDHEGAYGAAMAALRRDPGQLWPYGVLTEIALHHGNPGKGLEIASHHMEMAPHALEPAAQVARAQLMLHRHDEARTTLNHACNLAENCTDAHMLDTLGVLLARTSQHEKAQGFFERAVALVPDNSSLLYNLATTRQFIGDLEAARETYRTLLSIDPRHHRARLALVRLGDYGDPDKMLTELENHFAREGDDPDQALLIGHAIASVLEEKREWQASLAWLHRAKAGKRAERSYDPARQEALFAAAAETASLAIAPEPASAGMLSPIFIVGMPRSGTTLVEHIIGGHSMVAEAGELTDFAVLAKRAAGSGGPMVLDADTLENAMQADLAAVGTDYIARCRTLLGEPAFFTDKMPFNVFYAALILNALPSARIICLRRDPMDIIFSNYRQLFATGFSYYDYAYDLEATADFVARFEALADHWKQNLPSGRYREVRYEDVVADLELQARSLIDFCGLPWEDACMDFTANASPVATASSVQVRQPLYSTSIGRWARYGEEAKAIAHRFGRSPDAN